MALRPIRTATVAVALTALLAGASAAETVCPTIYQPVCAAKSDRSKTFANRCLAESAGYRVIDTGRCGEAGTRSKLRIRSSSDLGTRFSAAAAQCPALSG